MRKKVVEGESMNENLGGKKKEKMKTRTKTLAVVEIAIVLCSVFLVALPSISADQNQEMQKASASEVTAASEVYERGPLDVFGNANEDDTIDMRDTTYIKLVIFRKKPETKLADANNDGKVSMLDVGQTKLIILGKEKELTVVDDVERIVTINKPVERIIPLQDHYADAIRVLGAEDRVVGVGSEMPKRPFLYPVMSELPDVGKEQALDYEVILNLKPDLILHSITRLSTEVEDKIEQLDPNIKVLRLDINKPLQHKIEDYKKLGYILDKRNEAKDFIDFHEGIVNEITSRTEGLSEDERVRVYLEAGWKDSVCANKDSTMGQLCTIAGGRNIGIDLEGLNLPYIDFIEVDQEWILEQNPDIIIKPGGSWRSGYGTDDPTELIAKREQIMNRPGWEITAAVKHGKVYSLSGELLDSPQSFVAAIYFAKWFYPELFEDMDPQAIHQEYFDRFQRIDYNVYEHGVFVYPEPS